LSALTVQLHSFLGASHPQVNIHWTNPNKPLVSYIRELECSEVLMR
jgi:hypothetical protein